jgi:uncharacterized protein (DUF305 family)
MKNPLSTGLLGLILGIILTSIFYKQPQNYSTPTPSPMINHSADSMQDMVNNLQGKSGDDFDKAFLTGMIEHHLGAVEMAQEASISAKHQEIKDLSQAIISAQNQEIDQMREWQKNWSY